MMEALGAILIIFIGLAIRRSMHLRQALVLARLQTMTTIKMQPEIAKAWNDRRIIRRRLQAYGSK